MISSSVLRPRLLALAAAGCLAFGTAQAQISDDVVKIGVLSDMSSLYSDIGGPGSVVAAKMAVADFGGKVVYLRIGQGRAFKVSDKNVAFQENVRQDNRDTEFGELG